MSEVKYYIANICLMLSFIMILLLVIVGVETVFGINDIRGFLIFLVAIGGICTGVISVAIHIKESLKDD